jgi:hypothetical protein
VAGGGVVVLEEARTTRPPADTLPRAVGLVQSVALAATAAIVFGSVVLIGAVHISDRYLVNHVSGSWMTLARFVHDGTLYPPLHADGRTFGTFYMPLPFLAHGLVSLVTGEYLVSGKLTAYATALVLFGLLFALLRAVGCSVVVSAALVAAVVTTPAGYLATLSIRGDALSVVFQLAALLVIWRSRSKAAVLGAASLGALALASKTTGVWAPLAIAIWLFLRDRRLAARFAVLYVGLAVALLGVLELASGGRLAENLGALAFSQPKVPGATPLSGASTLVHLAFLDRDAPWLLFGCAAVAVVLFLRRREISLFQLALAISLLELVVILRDAGADYNHLLDMSVLTVLVVGELWAGLRPERNGNALAAAALTLAVVVSIASAYAQTMKPDIGLAARLAVGHGSDAAYSTHPLAGVVPRNASILSEDPSLPILSGRLPVTDPLILPRLASAHPTWIAQLQQRIRRHAFADVVLIRPLDPAGYHATQAFGRAVTASIAANYRFKTVIPTGSLTYYVYVPRARASD